MHEPVETSHIDPSAFTKKQTGRISEIITDVGVSMGTELTNSPDKKPAIHNTLALWDTGATHSAITVETVKALGLKPISATLVYHADGISPKSVYSVNLYLPNHVDVHLVKVTECKSIAGQFGVIIGMDIITLGDFSLTNKDGNTTVSFMIPSVHDFDFEDEINNQPPK